MYTWCSTKTRDLEYLLTPGSLVGIKDIGGKKNKLKIEPWQASSILARHVGICG